MRIKPIKRIHLSDKDQQHLTPEKHHRITQNKQPVNYRDKVVVKPWGHEFLLFENSSVAIWFLHIKKDHATSMHCHPLKKTSLTLIAGDGLCNTFRHRNFLCSGDSLIIDPAVFHSTKALSLDGISLVEVETPPDKLDLVRLQDQYGRENCGYEGCSQMVEDNLDIFDYYFFDDKTCNGDIYISDSRFSISMESYLSDHEFQSGFVLDPGAVYCVCDGRILNGNGAVVVDTGETERGGYLNQLEWLSIENALLLMKFTVFE